MKRLIVVGSLIGILILGACQFHVNLNPNPLLYREEKINLNVGLYIKESQIHQVHSQSGLCMIGFVHTWNIATGEAMAVAAERTFKNMFAQLEFVKNPDEFSQRPLNLCITPHLLDFHVSQGLKANLRLQCIMIDQEGNVIYESIIPASGSSQMLMGCLFGVFLGQWVVGKTSTEAFNQAFSFLAADMLDKVDFSMYETKYSLLYSPFFFVRSW